MAKLIDITGKALSGEWGLDDDIGDGIPVLRTTNFTNEGIVNYNNVVTRQINKKDLSKKYLRKGDIIIEKSGGSDKQPVGRVVFFDGEEGKYLFNNFTGLLRVVDQEKWVPRYVFYSLFSNYIQGGTRRFENKTTGLHNLKTDSYVESTEVKEIPHEKQLGVVEQLDRVIDLISLRKQQLAKLDELVKARFVELFGEPLNLLDSGKTIPLEKAFSRITVGFVGEAASSYVEVGVPYLRTQNVRKGYIDFSGLIYVSEEFHNANQKSKIKPDDIVVSRVGVNRGMAAVIPQKLEEANIANCLIISKEDSVNSTYLAYYLNMSYGLSPKFGASVGSAQGVINTAILKKWEVFLPSFAQQEKFAAFVEQTDKSKLAIQKSLDKLETLKKSLMQKYFG